jgi:hypothetical protein
MIFFRLVPFLLLSSIVFLSSCQKEVEGDFPQAPQADSGYLSQMVLMDTTQPAGSDTISKFFFNYDAQKRLTSIFTYNPGNSDTTRHTFTYNGNDSLPVQHVVDQEIHVGPSVFTTKYIIHFTTSGNAIVKDSTIRIINGTILGADVSRYVINGAAVDRFDAEYDYIGGNYVLNSRDTGVYSMVTTAGNLTKQSLTSGSASYESVQVSYDTKPNPLYRVYKIRYPVFENPYFEMWLLQKNNALTIQYKEPGGPVYHETYTYKYRTDGYPLSWTYFTDRGPNLYNKILYYYKTL